mmetsp:Transcript_32755/g.68641  ORF Transcript_32755/g.68641 Transcript_32755/m.68641 type:complete len:265 (+) Transcript_32755:51-845(+)
MHLNHNHCLTWCQRCHHTSHNIVPLLVHLIHIHSLSVLQSLSPSIVASLLLHHSTITIQRQRRKSPLALASDENSLATPSSRNGSRHPPHGRQSRGLLSTSLRLCLRSHLIQIHHPPLVQAISRRILRVSDGDPLGPIGCESLLVIPRQRAVADDASVGEDELPEGGDVEPMRGDFVFVCGVKIVVVLFLHGGVFPSFAVIVVYVLPPFVILLHRISDISIDLRSAGAQKLTIRLAKVVKHVEFLLIDTPLVQNLAMFLVLHVL